MVRTLCLYDVSVHATQLHAMNWVAGHPGVRLPATSPPPSPRQPKTVGRQALPKSRHSTYEWTECKKWRKMRQTTIKLCRCTNLRIFQLSGKTAGTCRCVITTTWTTKNCTCGKSTGFLHRLRRELLEPAAAVHRSVDNQELHCGISGVLHSLHSSYLSLWGNWNSESLPMN